MIFNTNQETAVESTTTDGDGGNETAETISISKSDWEKHQQTLGSLKRELKDLKKPRENEQVTPQKNQPDDALAQKFERMALKSAGITHEDDVELARKTAKKWGMDLDEVVDDEDFKLKLERQQSSRANLEATTGVKGDRGTTMAAKHTAEYWIAKGAPPTSADIPDAKVRRKINRAFLNANAGGDGKKFYND